MNPLEAITLLTKHTPSISRTAEGYARNAADRDDLFQEMCFSAYMALMRFRGECSEKTYIMRVIHNRGLQYCFNHRKFNSFHKLEESIDDHPEQRGSNPEQSLILSNQRTQLFAAIQSLPPKHKQAIMLSLEELTCEAIGEILGISANNAAVRINRARTELIKKMESRS